MKKLLIFLICVAPLTISAQALTEAQIRDFKTQTIAKNKSIQTMQADFTQKKHLDFMSKDIETLGKMAFAKPDKLNWQYTKPYNLIVSSISGDMFNEKEFTMSFAKSGNSTLVKLLPNDKTLLKYVSEIHLYFGVDSVVERVKLIEPSKDYTEILFNNKKLNTKIDEANFKM